MSIDPKFATAIKKARVEGEAEIQRKHQESCDRGAKVLQQILDDPNYQSRVLSSVRSSPGFDYCEGFPASMSQSVDIITCLSDKNHAECKRLSTFISPGKRDSPRLCFNHHKLSQ